MKEKILTILKEIKALQDKDAKEYTLPENTFYLNDTDILCKPRKNGDTRYPYEMDGLTLCVHTSGYIDARESNFVIFKQLRMQDDAPIEFWGGVKNGDEWIPVSVTGATKPLYEPVTVSRYMIYAKCEAYFIAETVDFIFALRASLTTKKQINFTASVINKTNTDKEAYITSFINPTLRFCEYEDDWELLNRVGFLCKNGSFKLCRKPNPEGGDGIDLPNYVIVNKAISTKNHYEVDTTVTLHDFLGEQGRTVFNALPLRTGSFNNHTDIASYKGTTIATDIVKFRLNPNEEALVNYIIDIAHSEEDANGFVGQVPDISEIEKDLQAQESADDKMYAGFAVNFGKLKETELNNNVFNKFIKNVQRQVTYCAMGKNYNGELLGVRDVFQQLTATTLWNTDKAREKIVKSLNFIMENGRSPRQFSIPPVEDVIPKFDIRQFIDQGYWVIETLYKYISITADYSILDEKCSYYKIIDEKKDEYAKSDCIDSVLDHLVKITDYLTSNIDERTGCQMILYGDWNDSISELGKSLDGLSEFGTGVTIMGTLQLYQALEQMSEILTTLGKYTNKADEYRKIRGNIALALEKHAKVQDGDSIHLLHGWGDKGAYQVGSLCDTDGKKRYSVNPYSFWCICNMLERDTSMKESILKAYDILDSKYGIKTFDQPFTKESTGIGRINRLTPGTYENAATYVHATMFAVMALFIMGESKRAWEQIFKAIPITHNYLTKTPFVMPNSYFYNEELNIDGQSGGDWHTGSGAVLMRCIIEYALGFLADAEHLKIEVPSYLPSDNVEMKLHIKNCDLKFIYKNTGTGERNYYVNGIKQETFINQVSGMPYILIDNKDIGEKMTIEVID